MEARVEEITRRPIYAYDIPKDILSTLKLKEDVSSIPVDQDDEDAKQAKAQRSSTSTTSSTSCALCNQTFVTVEEQRSHVRSDLHNYNLKQRIRNAPAVSENEFETLVKDLDESLSGSDDSNSEDDSGSEHTGNMLSNLLKKQATVSKENYDEEGRSAAVKTSGRAPLLWFESPTLPENTYLGVYRALFSSEALSKTPPVDLLRQKQLQPKQFPANITALTPAQAGPHIFMCMIGGGHFAAMIVALSPAIRRNNATGPLAKEAVVIAHKTFHRYTTRRKQGGSQSANDSAKGAAHSAGAGIRRYNEAALKDEVRLLLTEWKDMITTSELQFVRATGTENRRTLFGPYEGQVLHSNDERVRGFPFNTRRATQKELMRAFIELTRVKVKVVDEAAIAAAAAASQAAKDLARHTKEKAAATPKDQKTEGEETAQLHTSQIQALIKRSRLPALLQYLSSNNLPADFRFHPQDAHFHAPTPLHLAASLNAPVIVTGLMAKANADPTLLNGDGKPPYDLAGDRPTRDAFRLARHKLDTPEVGTWDWESAHIPSPLSEGAIEARRAEEVGAAQKAEEERRKAETERLTREGPKVEGPTQLGKAAGRGRALALGAAGKTAEEKRREEMKGLTPEMRMRIERERRARAAEERVRKMQSGGGT